MKGVAMKIFRFILRESEKTLENIFDKHFKSSNKKFEIEDAITLGFYEDIVRKVDALKILLDANKLVSIDSITRDIFESYVYFKLLLTNERRLYAKSYMAAKEISELTMYNKLIEDNKNGRKLRELLNTSIERVNKDIGFNSEEKLKRISNIYTEVFEKRRKNQKWYNLDSKTQNLEQLCNKLDLFAEYNLVYRLLSAEVHASDVMKRWKFEPNQVSVFEAIDNKDMNIKMINLFLLDATRELYSFYGLKKELRNFNTLLSINYNYSKK